MADNRLRIADSRDYFVQDNRPFFYLADTVWSAFTSATEGEWSEYLAMRWEQGFNALQINVLPQWDRSVPDLGFSPFETASQGGFAWDRPNEEYFARAERMLAAARDRGFQVALVALWANYVPGTWLSAPFPSHVMPFERLEPYVSAVATRFRQFEPMYFVSGDTNFAYEETNRYYLAAIDAIKRVDPDALLTLHLMGLSVDLPEVLYQAPLDFHIYQSGHHRHEQNHAYQFAERMLQQRRTPLLNSEPCYEGISIDVPKPGRDANSFGPRITSAEVRRAIWWSLLSGAKAGLGYGAHGVWCWHDQTRKHPTADLATRTPYDSVTPDDWRTALGFESARDALLAKRMFEEHDLFSLSAARLLRTDEPDIRMLSTPDFRRIAIYQPAGKPVLINPSVASHAWSEVDLPSGHSRPLRAEPHDGGTLLHVTGTNDVVLLASAVS